MTAAANFRIFPNLYKDSVTLMQLGAELRSREGIAEASCIMATPANLTQLADAGLAVDAAVAPSDLLVVVRGEPSACEEAIAAADAMLKSTNAGGGGDAAAFRLPLSSIAIGLQRAEAADIALISVPGDYAAAEALKALAQGLHVMVFSDNVAIADERSIKDYARARNLLVMGPDCGTAIVNGIPLGFANVVRRGDIGLVAASGTGLQEVTCRIHNAGGGVSQAIGTGGRDLKDAIGGITMLQGLAALAADPATRVIVLISKPPAPDIAQKILALASKAGKPVVVHFLGAKPESVGGRGLTPATSLQHAGDVAVALAKGSAVPASSGAPTAIQLATVTEMAAGMAASQYAVRGLFTGGTFCYEAQIAFRARNFDCRSNAPAESVGLLEKHDGHADGHVFIDMGDDDYTRGRPHPMIDPALRNAAVLSHAADPATAAILVDVVLGYGSHPDPAQALADALFSAQREARARGRSLALVAHVCGTDGDPQGRATQVRKLEAAGAILAESNVQAALVCAALAETRKAARRTSSSAR
jgi:succinyl-CoA synthetase alpha subunit